MMCLTESCKRRIGHGVCGAIFVMCSCLLSPSLLVLHGCFHALRDPYSSGVLVAKICTTEDQQQSACLDL